jgi:hypothetical protein
MHTQAFTVGQFPRVPHAAPLAAPVTSAFAAGTQFAGLVPVSAVRAHEGSSMASKAMIVAGALLAATPAAIALLWPASASTEPLRSVELSGPILGFTQTHDRIQIRLRAPATPAERAARTQVIVRDAEGDELSLPLKPGQTWVAGELPEKLADSSALMVRVE